MVAEHHDRQVDAGKDMRYVTVMYASILNTSTQSSSGYNYSSSLVALQYWLQPEHLHFFRCHFFFIFFQKLLI